MLSALARSSARVAAVSLRSNLSRPVASGSISSLRKQMSSKPYAEHPEQDPEFDDRWIAYFNKEDIDDWELRKGVNKLGDYDHVPDPRIIIAGLKAARRLNDFQVAVRIVELVWYKSAFKDKYYQYVLQEIKPTMDELGVPEPKDIGLTGKKNIYSADGGKWGF